MYSLSLSLSLYIYITTVSINITGLPYLQQQQLNMNNNLTINNGINHPMVFNIPDRRSISEIRLQQDIVDNHALCTDTAKIADRTKHFLNIGARGRDQVY
jgi:hypothetical protein